MSDVTAEISLDYEINALRLKAKRLTRLADQEKFQAISELHHREQRKEITRYKHDYRKRRQLALRHLIETRGLDAVSLRKGKDPASKRKRKILTKAAHQIVQRDHLRRMTELRRREAKELRDLVEIAELRQQAKDAPAPEVKLITDQRDAPSRKLSPSID